VNDEHPESDDLLLTIAFESIKTQLKRDLKKYEKYIEKQKVNGALGGRPRKTQDNPEVNSETQKTQAFFSKPKKADNDNDNDNVTVNVNDIIVVSTTDKKKTFKNWSKEEFIEDLKQFSEEYPKDTLNAFFLYWSESSASGKMRFQLEKTWESARRLIRWKESNPVAKIAPKTEAPKAPAPITPKFLQEQNAD
jgi:hypothetical protein